jgi:two-component system chemotaxis response regulator CheB
MTAMGKSLAAGPRIRVLVVDDSVVARRSIADLIGREPELEVVGTAASGKLALGKLRQLAVDVVTLDVEMPDETGLQTLDAIRKEWPRLPVLMCSGLTERGAAATLDALSRGASDYVAKPSSVDRGTLALAFFTTELTAKLKVLGRQVRPVERTARPASLGLLQRTVTSVATARAEVVAIGVSTGGPNALAAMIPLLPRQMAAPVLIVQHMPPIFTRMLAERLAGLARRPAREARDGEVLEDGVIYIAPGDYHMRVARDLGRPALHLDQRPPENSCRPAVDPLFESVAALYGPAALGVILTGMGKDGLRGCERIRAAGGRVLAQDEATSVVWGMPGYVTTAGLADEVLPLPEIAAAITRRVRGPRAREES